MLRVTVAGVPEWVPAERLLGDLGWVRDGEGWVAELPQDLAADVQERLRGLGLGGRALEVEVKPPLGRAAVRAARTRDARRRRERTLGFTRKGVRLDDEGRVSLTPEALALAIGMRARGRQVVDAMCGAGGNAIGFARAGCAVVAIDRHPGRLANAQHNARVYGVADRIRFVLGDAATRIREVRGGLVFVDPPWGADYDRVRVGIAGLPELPPVLAAAGPREVWIKVPPSFDPADLPGFSPEAWFGRASGDRRRVKFLLLTGTGAIPWSW